MKRTITNKMLKQYEQHLLEEEKSPSTVQKYMCDIRKLADYLGDAEVDKNKMIAYKEKLLKTDKYKVSSVNSYLVAANKFLEYMGWQEAKVKTYKVQRESFCSEKKYLTKGEYKRLVQTARKKKNIRLVMILQTICATGMRVSELQFITVENVEKGMVDIHCKGKMRTILLPGKLQKELRRYIRKEKITEGMVFCTATGNAIHRSNIWKEMQSICEEAKVEKDKVFPHNLRHLFAQCFYEIKPDIAKLADVLGHSSIETTRIYIRTTCNEHRKQLEMMNLVCCTNAT